nr:PAS domain-containing protein [Chloroflexia bacterium]
MNDLKSRRPGERGTAASNGEASPSAETSTQLIGTDRYTMAEAAKLKGVSYHTVSRAVRAGRLPVQRLGRMALIAGDDLNAWQPMRERAPKRYRRNQPEADASPVFLDASLGERLELAKRLSTLYKIIHGGSSELPLEQLSELICGRMVEVFHLTRGTLWLFDDALLVATRVASIGGRMSSLGDQVDLPDYPVFLEFANGSVTRVSPNVKIEMEEVVEPAGGGTLGPVLALTLEIGGRTIGGFFGDRSGAPFELPEDHLVLARVLANQAALAIDHARLRDRERSRVNQLSAILDQLRQGVRACDEHGRLTFVNASDRRFSGETEGATPIGGDAFQNHAILARYDLEGNPIRGDRHPLARALDGEKIIDWEYDVVLKDGSRRRVAVNANPVLDDGRIAGAVYTARDLTAQRVAERQAADRLRELAIAARRAEAVADILSEISTVRSAAAALEVTIRRMSDELLGSGGLIMLRDVDGRFSVSATHGVTIPPTLATSFEPIAIPSTILALASQEPTQLAYEDASVAERQLMDAVGARFQLIVPLNVGERHIGVAYVNYDDAPGPTHLDMTFAATLGRQCVHAVDQIEIVSRIDARARHLLNVLDQLPQGVLIIDEPGAVVSLINRSAQRLWGEPLQARTLRADDLRMIDPEGRPYSREYHPLLRPFRTGNEYLGEPLTIERPDGSHVDILGNHAPVFGPDGSIVGGVSVLQDREHFKPLDRAKDEFLSVVAHELRNPLTALRGNLQ